MTPFLQNMFGTHNDNSVRGPISYRICFIAQRSFFIFFPPRVGGFRGLVEKSTILLPFRFLKILKTNCICLIIKVLVKKKFGSVKILDKKQFRVQHFLLLKLQQILRFF